MFRAPASLAGEFGKKSAGWARAEHFSKHLVIVLLFIIVVIAAVCWLGASAAQRAHSYRCGGGPDEFGNYGEGGNYGEDEEAGAGYLGGPGDAFGAGELNSVTGGGDGIARLGIREPWFSEMLKGKKKVEGRLRRGAAVTLKKGDLITVARSRAPGDLTEYGKPYRYITKVKRVSTYKTLRELVEAEKPDHLFPGKKMSADEAVAAYREHFQEADEAEVSRTLPDAVVAIEVEPYSEKAQAELAAAARAEQHFY